MHSLGRRIRAVRSHAGLRQDEFGAKIGISANRLSEIEHDKGGTNAVVLIAICKIFPVNPEWLLAGSGEMLKSTEPSVERKDDISDRLHTLERQMERFGGGGRGRTPLENLLRIPLYSSAVPAGMPDPATGDVEEYLDMPASWTRGKKNIYALKVNGDSMIDIGIMPGDTLLVEAGDNARDGQVVIASINAEVTVKTLCISPGGTVSLAPENRRYRPIAITPEMDFRIMGIVLAALRHYG